ncbi:MAG TPA: 4'-phosphopantetheinyl transferase superfamily protein [Candidatus Sulfotelmatobacter sp.]|nr:4'-phosphopantetheinyl transferase superfamily protein [Candidatus Sulfotelmatobacter sp.]
MHITTPEHEFPSTLSLPADEVHLWRIDLQAAAMDDSAWQDLLSEDEEKRARQFRSSVDRCYFTAVRGSLRRILAAYLSTDPKGLAFSYSEKGKPSLGKGNSAKGVQFNVSHSGGAALLAFTLHRAIGVDIERIRADVEVDKIAGRFFSNREQEQLQQMIPGSRVRGFFQCWTRKEAYIKATGAGLSLPLGQFDVSIDSGQQNCLLATRPDSQEAQRWKLIDVPAGNGFAAALCVLGSAWTLREWSTTTSL